MRAIECSICKVRLACTYAVGNIAIAKLNPGATLSARFCMKMQEQKKSNKRG